jgi:hypothetical protein
MTRLQPQIYRFDPAAAGPGEARLQRCQWPVLPVLVLLVMLTTPGAALAQQTPTATPPSVLGQDAGLPCADGRLKIKDLASADASMADGVTAARNAARKWRDDARLVILRLGCPLLESGLRWDGTFFSDSAQAYITTETGKIEPAEDDPRTIPTLVTDGLSFRLIYRSLLKAGFDDSLELVPGSGVTVQMSTEQQPFGPPSAPRGQIYFHLAIEERGEVKDVWVNSVDGTIYRYEM